MRKYIISIYREEKNKPGNIIGVVEEVGVRGRNAFTNFDELWDIVNPRHHNGSDKNNTSKNHSTESRKHTRKNIAFFTDYSTDSSSGNFVSNGVITNISKSGLCLLTPETLNEGKNIFIKCNKNSPARMATVRWSKQYKDCHCRAGLEFEGYKLR